MQLLLERMKYLGATADGLDQALAPDRHDHEFLEVDRIVGMRAAVDDVHHWRRQHMRSDASHITIERKPARFRGSLGNGQADAENAVGPKATLIFGPVELDHYGIDLSLIFGLEAFDRFGNLAIHRIDGVVHALAAPAALIAVAALHRLARTGRSARWDRGAAEAAILQRHVDLDRRIAATVDHGTGVDVDDRCHKDFPRLLRLKDGVASIDDEPCRQ